MIPTEVPVLTHGNICKNKYWQQEGVRCIVGWCDFITEDRDGVWTFEGQDVRYLAGKVTGGKIPLSQWNDRPSNTKERIAQLFNRTTALLGYTEGNPEAAWANRNRKKFDEFIPGWAKE